MDVCRICIDAWKTSAEIQALTGAQVVPQPIIIPRPDQALQQVTPKAQPPQPPPETPIIELTAPPTSETRETYELLHELDAMFINDGIDADDYVKRRRELVGRLATYKAINLPAEALELIKLDEELEITSEREPFKKVLPILLIEQKKIGVNVTKVPGDWMMPPDLTEQNLRSIISLYKSLKDRRVLIQFNGTKLGLLGRKCNKILCVVLEPHESLEDYEDEINYLSELLSETEDFNELLNILSAEMEKTKNFSRQPSLDEKQTGGPVV